MGFCCSKVNKINDETIHKKNQKNESKIEFTYSKVNKVNNENINQKVEQNNVDQIESFEYNIKEWKDLIEKLTNNDTLNEYALAKKRDNFSSLKELVWYLKQFKCENEIEKAWLIYVWITHNIEYDIEKLENGNHGDNDPDSVLIIGKCIDEGYSNLFGYLCKNFGLESKNITGFSKGICYSIETIKNINHIWNVIKLDNKWYFVDCTWGANGSSDGFKYNKEFNPYWFFTPSQLIINLNYCESFQLQSKKMSLKEFENLPFINLEFHLLDLKCISHNSSIIESKTNYLFMEFSAPKDTLIEIELNDNNIEIKNVVIIQRDALSLNYGLIVIIPDKNKSYNLKIYGKKESNTELFKYCGTFIVKRKIDNDTLKLPNYSLEFKYNLKCLSHSSHLIRNETNPINLIFSAPQTTLILVNLKDKNNNKIENSVLVQRSENQESFEIKAILPQNNYLYTLAIYAKNANESGSYRHVADFKLIRSKDTNKIDQIKYLNVYTLNGKSYIYSPIECYLELGVEYKFKYYFENASQVALINSDSEWFYLNNDSETIWTIDKAFNETGQIKLFVKFKSKNCYYEFCSYIVSS